MKRLYHSIIKETKVIIRDKEALLLLFAMPTAFVLIMSLAMKDAFGDKGNAAFSVVIIDNDRSVVGETVTEVFSFIPAFKVEMALPGGITDPVKIQDDVNAGRHKFAVIIPEGATKGAVRRIRQQLAFTKKGPAKEVSIRLFADPALRPDQNHLAASTLNRALQGIENRLLWEQFGEVSGVTPQGSLKETAEVLRANKPFAEVYPESPASNVQGAHKRPPMPTAVQQSVPAWSLFAMFMLIIPLSVTFIKERQQGALLRLRSMPAPAWVIICGKAAPFCVINQLQFVSMLLVGIYVVPLLGGDALTIEGGSYAGIAIVSMSASLAAVGYGVMASVFCKTAEQATTFGGTSVIIFGALGGIMVPKFLMPPVMQKITVISPMGWGLDAFLDIFVRGGGVRDILTASGALLIFAIACAITAGARFKYLSR
ncbi:MAG: ABC transporter permease [Deltaproteobacteria bacterium]|nr:ABC transporter permease [Deltaproteobacteria bacterium]